MISTGTFPIIFKIIFCKSVSHLKYRTAQIDASVDQTQILEPLQSIHTSLQSRCLELTRDQYSSFLFLMFFGLATINQYVSSIIYQHRDYASGCCTICEIMLKCLIRTLFERIILLKKYDIFTFFASTYSFCSFEYGQLCIYSYGLSLF